MSKDQNGGPAFPVPPALPMSSGKDRTADGGMSLRDYFAAQGLAALLSSGDFLDPSGLFTQNGANGVAYGAYLLADAMLAERSK